jgi:hypothetical protein
MESGFTSSRGINWTYSLHSKAHTYFLLDIHYSHRVPSFACPTRRHQYFSNPLCGQWVRKFPGENAIPLLLIVDILPKSGITAALLCIEEGPLANLWAPETEGKCSCSFWTSSITAQLWVPWICGNWARWWTYRMPRVYFFVKPILKECISTDSLLLAWGGVAKDYYVYIKIHGPR